MTDAEQKERAEALMAWRKQGGPNRVYDAMHHFDWSWSEVVFAVNASDGLYLEAPGQPAPIIAYFVKAAA